jgi:uncharacterized membrane protein YphA (DoxX/SURF4 family)
MLRLVRKKDRNFLKTSRENGSVGARNQPLPSSTPSADPAALRQTRVSAIGAGVISIPFAIYTLRGLKPRPAAVVVCVWTPHTACTA